MRHQRPRFHPRTHHSRWSPYLHVPALALLHAGGTYLVGEQGPELLRMSGPGMVYNNSQTNKLMNQSLNKSNPINVYVSSNIDQRYLKVGIEKYNANQKYIRA